MKHTLSTITVNEIIPTAQKAVELFTKRKSQSTLMRYFGSHYTLDDLVMDAVEKVIRANPMYLTKSYVYTAARCVCIDRLQQRKIPWAEIESLYEHEDGDIVPVEELLEADTFDHMGSLDEYLEECLHGKELEVYKALKERKLYIEIAENLGISLRTLERIVHELKYKMEVFLLEPES